MENTFKENSATNPQSSQRRYTFAPSYVVETSLDEEWEKQRMKSQTRRRSTNKAATQERRRIKTRIQD